MAAGHLINSTFHDDEERISKVLFMEESLRDKVRG